MIKHTHSHESPPTLSLAPLVAPAAPPVIAEEVPAALNEHGEEHERTAGKLIAWLPLFYIGAITAAELVFIECYCHWHGAQFLLPDPLRLYSAENIAKLSKIGFVSGTPPTTMDFTAEILMWASLGVWSQRIASMVARYQQHRPSPPHDLAEYIGVLGCHTSIAAALMIVLELSKFTVFGISLDSFQATAGTAFILGYFGKETERLLARLRDQIFGKKNLPRNTSSQG